jgi:hypothetical protein
MAKIKIGAREFEVSDEVISKAQEEKKPIEISIEGDFIVREKTEEESFVANLKNEAKTAGLEIAIKETRNALGLDFQGKTMENLIKAVQDKAIEDAKIEPEEKVKNLMKDVETLKGTIQTLTTEKTTLEGSFKTFKQESTVNSTLQTLIPDNILLPKEDMLLIVKNKLGFELDESNRLLVKKNGEVLKNQTTLDPIAPQEAIKSFFDDNPQYLKQGDGGRGGDDSGSGGGKTTVEKFMEQKAKEGVSHTDPKFIAELEELKKQGLIEM